MNVVEEVRALNLPPGHYVVYGSGILGVLGIREVKDIDLLVSPELFETLKSNGWEYSEVDIEGRMRKKLSRGFVEAYKDFWYGNENPDVAEMIRGAKFIDGVPFAPLSELLKIKKAFHREKDIRDVQLIEGYLKSNPNTP